MEFFDKEIMDYALAHTSPEPPMLKQISRETYQKVLNPRMLSGHLQGRLLALLSKLTKPRNVLEIGTFTGYSALCLAEGLTEGGRVITIEANEELEPMIRDFFRMANMEDRIELVIGDARDVIPRLNFFFDIVFIDADKEIYEEFYDLVIDKTASGGLIVADNVLWSGKVVNRPANDKSSASLIRFNRKVQNDDRVENILLPVRDGLMIIRKL